MVADILRLAAVDGFDILVLVSGDADLAPAVENVRSLGKKVYVATWGRTSLAARLRQAAFDHLDLLEGLDKFRSAGLSRLIVTTAALAETEERPPASSTPVREAEIQAVGERPTPFEAPTFSETSPEDASDAAFLFELSRAERKLGQGYVGVSFFLNRWRSDVLDPTVAVRQRILDRLVDRSVAELYDAPDGSKAIRRARSDAAQATEGSP